MGWSARRDNGSLAQVRQACGWRVNVTGPGRKKRHVVWAYGQKPEVESESGT
jgi:hypothetical protein